MERRAFAAGVAVYNQPSLQVHFSTHQPYPSPSAVLIVAVSSQHRLNFVASAVESSLYQRNSHQGIME
jgi:hypothetical protein